jgi:hypothetical protein
VGRAGKEKGINNELEVEVIFSLNESSYGKHIFGRKGFGTPTEIFDNSRRAPEANGIESLDFHNPEIIALVYPVSLGSLHILAIGTPGSKLQAHRSSRKAEYMPQAIR